MWIPQMQRHYYNPTSNRIPVSILGNWQRFALEEADTNDFVGIDNARYDDIPSNWDGISPRPVTVPVQPVVMMSLAERAEKVKAMKAARKAKG
jgi:hypothetical protein